MDDKGLMRQVAQLKRHDNTWRDVGEMLGISGALAWRVANGLSDSKHARHVLGLPPKTVKVEPCPKCGEVHKLKRCNQLYRRGSRKRIAFDIPADFTEHQELLLRALTKHAFLLYRREIQEVVGFRVTGNNLTLDTEQRVK